MTIPSEIGLIILGLAVIVLIFCGAMMEKLEIDEECV